MVGPHLRGRQILTSDPLTASRRHYWVGLGLILLACVLLSIISTFARLAYESGATPTTLLWLRFLGFIAVIGGYHFIRRRPVRLAAHYLWGTGIMALGMLMNSVGYLGSVAYIKIGLSVVLFYTFPIVTLILSTAIKAERPTPAKILCLLAAFGGVMLASYRNIGDAFDWRGVALILMGALGFAIAIVFGNRAMRGGSPLTMNLWMNVWMVLAMTALMSIPAVQQVLGRFTWPTGATAWFGTVAATGCYILGFSCFFAAVQLLPPSQTGIMMNLEPLIATAAAMLVLGEPVYREQWLGMVIILVALALSSLLGARRTGTAPRPPEIDN